MDPWILILFTWIIIHYTINNCVALAVSSLANVSPFNLALVFFDISLSCFEAGEFAFWLPYSSLVTGVEEMCTGPAAAATAKSPQSCLTLCDPIDGSPSGSPVPGILQARILEWVAISFSNAWKWKVKVKTLSCVWLLATPWIAAYQAPPFMGLSRQEYWSGVPLLSPGPVLDMHK